MVTVLIDGDILTYEVGFGVNTGWKGEGVPPFDYAAEMLDARISFIVHSALCAFDNPESYRVRIFLSGPENFRIQIAKRKGYKENRKDSVKPFHYHNIKAYMQNVYDVTVTDGIEADDALCIERAKDPENTIVCSRDKDLRQHQGWIYSWECGKQPSFGPFYVSGYGEIELSKDRKKIVGYGPKFFLSQCLTGDTVDNVCGLPGIGPVVAYELLKEKTTYLEMYETVKQKYVDVYGDSYEEELAEQANLLYLIKDQKDKLFKMWRPPNSDYENWYNIDTGKIERTSIS